METIDLVLVLSHNETLYIDGSWTINLWEM